MLKTSLLLLLALPGALLAQVAVRAPAPFGGEATRTFPYSMAGQILFVQGDSYYQGTGTVIRPNSVLTAAHNLWDADKGFSTELVFRRALYDGASEEVRTPSRIYVLGGYREKARSHGAADVRAFGYDLGALIFAQPPANGSYAGWWANPALLAGDQPIVALGYGAQYHSGDQLLSVAPTHGFEQITGAFYDSESLFFEPGMSGGPVFGKDSGGKLFVAGVVVAGSLDDTLGGIRILDATASAFIRSYLK